MTLYRGRIITDFIYKSEDGKPLAAPHLTMLANRTATYVRIAATEGLEDLVEIVHDKDFDHQTAHHHDARYEQCAQCRRVSRDELGPID